MAIEKRTVFLTAHSPEFVAKMKDYGKSLSRKN
jgi:hypothetical protein